MTPHSSRMANSVVPEVNHAVLKAYWFEYDPGSLSHKATPSTGSSVFVVPAERLLRCRVQ